MTRIYIDRFIPPSQQKTEFATLYLGKTEKNI